MNKPIWTAALLGTPHTKKNSQRILAGRYGGRYIAPSKKYTEYEQAACTRSGGPGGPSTSR